MNYVAFATYAVLSFVAVILTVVVAVVCFKKKTDMARSIALSCIGAFIATTSYFVRILTSSELCFSIATTFHLIGIDISLVFFFIFTLFFTKYCENPWKQGFIRLAILYSCVEVVIYVINIFYPIAIDYSVRDTPVTKFVYNNLTLVYWGHIVFSYVLIMSIFFILIRRAKRIPRQFGRQHIGMAVGLLVILVANFLGGGFHKGVIDYGVGGYCMLVVFMYWYVYQYPTRGMLNFLKMSVFDNVDQAIVLFDYSGRLVLRNERAKQMFSHIDFSESLEQKEFVKACNINLDLESGVDVFSFQCNVKPKTVTIPLRCDFRRLRNKSDFVLGRLFVFSDAVLDTDNLTNFQDWESFKLFATNNKDAFTFPMMAVVCDINNLSIVNSTRGHSAGDRLMRDFATAMKEFFPQGTYFVRGPEAELIALSYGLDPERVNECIEKIRSRVDAKFLYSMEEASSWMPSVMVAIESANRALRQKKLLDKDSTHSELLGSLIKALEECDSDTEAHVQRTQKMGEALGKRIGLTDRQQSDLSLLCLLHDIGKIGVPLEILNKPTKLTSDEWKTIQSHVEKGYQIAKSSKDLYGIADMIRHHHERWDGRGYPDALSKENIPLLSRVICVVDSFDAMISDRAYRKGMSVDDAMTELMRCSGTQFDPFLVSEFLPICQMMASEKGDASVPRNPTTKMKSLQGDVTKKSVVKRVHDLCYSRYTLDSEMKIIEVDDNFEKLTGYSREDVANMNLYHNDLIPKDDLTEYMCLTAESLANKQMAYCEHRIVQKDGGVIYVICYGRVYFDSVSKDLRSEIIITNSAETYAMKVFAAKEREKNGVQLQEWDDSYRRDSLTGLLNYKSFKESVEDKIAVGESKVMLMMLDVDKFKDFNESGGLLAGDELLRFVARTIRDSLRGNDMSCRVGDDEFSAALMFKKDCSSEFMCLRAQQIFDKILMTLSSSDMQTSLSMGVSITENEIRNYEQLHEAAVGALASAKNSGRSRIVIYDHQ